MSLTLIEKKLSQLRGHIRLMFFSWGLAKLTMWAAGLTLWLFYTDLLLKLPGGLRVGFLVEQPQRKSGSLSSRSV